MTMRDELVALEKEWRERAALADRSAQATKAFDNYYAARRDAYECAFDELAAILAAHEDDAAEAALWRKHKDSFAVLRAMLDVATPTILNRLKAEEAVNDAAIAAGVVEGGDGK